MRYVPFCLVNWSRIGRLLVHQLSIRSRLIHCTLLCEEYAAVDKGLALSVLVFSIYRGGLPWWTLLYTEGNILIRQTLHELLSTLWTDLLEILRLDPEILQQLLPIVPSLIQVLIEFFPRWVVILWSLLFHLFGELLLSQIFKIEKATDLW